MAIMPFMAMLVTGGVISHVITGYGLASSGGLVGSTAYFFAFYYLVRSAHGAPRGLALLPSVLWPHLCLGTICALDVCPPFTTRTRGLCSTACSLLTSDRLPPSVITTCPPLRACPLPHPL
jgi:hypothetical protein